MTDQAVTEKVENIKRKALVDIEVYTQKAATSHVGDAVDYLQLAKLCAEVYALLEHGCVPVDTSLLTEERLGAGTGEWVPCCVCGDEFNAKATSPGAETCGDAECDAKLEADRDEAGKEWRAGI